jgi:hypothetical protein
MQSDTANEGASRENLSVAREMALGGLFCALGMVVPILFHAAGLGRVFLPMHLPVLAAGMLLRPRIALAVGLLTPWGSMLLTGMPPFPLVILLSLELAALAGTAAVLLSLRLPWLVALPAAVCVRCLLTWLLTSLFGSMLGLPAQAAGWAAVLAGLPGILLQIVCVPPIFLAMQARRRAF